jgi:uncharacterized protein (DUF1501 family)
MKRRTFLQTASLVGGGILVPVGFNSWAARGMTQTGNRKRTIVIFLRGAIDGLSVVVPHQESIYYEARPNIAVAYPNEKGGAIDLDGYFGLHPDLADLMPLWKNKTLAFIHACGSPDETRSHFDAQDYMETGTPGLKNTPDGWMNRLLAVLSQGQPQPTQALNIGVRTPRILEGKMSVASLPPGKAASNRLPVDNPEVNTAFDRLYEGSDNLSKAYQEGRKAREIIMSQLNAEMKTSAKGAPATDTFVRDAAEVAKLMLGESRTQIAFMDFGGWDSHINQKELLQRYLKPLGRGLATLVKELKPIYKDTTIIVMSEFGRTVKENGNRGTDHGHGNAMWVLGGSVRGGQIYGKWPTLEESQLFEARDLAVTTDFRDAIASVLEQHLSVPKPLISRIFPNYQLASQLQLIG